MAFSPGNAPGILSNGNANTLHTGALIRVRGPPIRLHIPSEGQGFFGHEAHLLWSDIFFPHLPLLLLRRGSIFSIPMPETEDVRTIEERHPTTPCGGVGGSPSVRPHMTTAGCPSWTLGCDRHRQVNGPRRDHSASHRELLYNEAAESLCYWGRMSESLLITKITLPTRHHRFIPRQRIATRLHHLIDVPLTLISAPAGFGKTMAMHEALHTLPKQHRAALAWLTLDTHDNDPVHFWRYIALALHSAANDCGAVMIEALAGPQPAPVRPLLAVTLNEIATQARHLVLVLDDYHFVDLPAIHDDLTFLIDHAPSNMHILLITRTDPPLPLHHWRARGQLLEVRAADLRFDPTEAAGLLNGAMRLGFDEEEMATLLRQTEGWPAALYLAGLALREDDPAIRHQRIERLAQSNRFIIEYLTEEILAQQPPDVHEFLLCISVLERFCGPLCDAVAGRSGSAALLKIGRAHV